MALDKPQALEFRCEKPQIIGDGHITTQGHVSHLWFSFPLGMVTVLIPQMVEAKQRLVLDKGQAGQRGVLRGQALGIRDSRERLLVGDKPGWN